MSGPARPLHVAAAILSGMLACGIPLWPVAYREVSMPGNPAPGAWLFLGALAGLAAGYLIRRGLAAPVLSIALGFGLAVFARMLVETAKDPTSHNLWPFEVAIALAFGLVAGSLGVGAARALQRFGPGK
jgi:uncharacterized membrane protein YfcA